MHFQTNNPFSAQKNRRITTACILQRREQRRPGQAGNLEAADARALNSESSPQNEFARMADFRELSAATGCAKLGPGCWIPFWDALNGPPSVSSLRLR